MTSFKKPKVYFGAGGFTGVGTIGKSPIVGARKPMVYGGGVSAAKVLTGGGISRGGVMGLSSSPSVVAKPKPEKRPEKFSKTMAEKEKEFIEADAKAEKPGEAEVRKNMMEMARESKTAAVDRNPPKAVVVEAAIEPQTEPPTMGVLPELPAAEEEAPVPQVEVTVEELPKYTGFSKGEWGTGNVTTPELPLGGNGGKKKRRHRRKH